MLADHDMSKSNSRPRVLIIIVNYKTPALVCELLESIVWQLPVEDHVCVVDNASGDGSIGIIKDFVDLKVYNAKVSCIESDRNGGFSYGNNLAIKTVLGTDDEPHYFLLLNPDTTVNDQNSINELIKFAETQPKAGVIGGQIETETGEIQHSAFRFHTILSEIENALRLGYVSKLLANQQVVIDQVNKPMEVDWVSGAYMLIRVEVIRDIGLMDEAYFLYFEETDFCFQAKRAGWTCWYYPNSRIVHYVGQSTGVVSGDNQNRRRPKYWFDSRQRYFVKNHGFMYALATDIVWGIGFSVWRLRRFLQDKPDLDPKYMLSDFWKNSLLFSIFKRK